MGSLRTHRCVFQTLRGRVKKNQPDAQLILGIFCQPLHVSGVSTPIIRRYNRMYTTFCTYYSFYMAVCCPGWIVAMFQSNKDNRQSSKKDNKYQILCYVQLHLLMMGLDTPETCRVWRNILRISCASSWVFFTRLYRDAQAKKHKT